MTDADGQDRVHRILLIEDEPDMVALMQRHMAGLRCRMSIARSGEEGLAMAYADRPDLVILDIMLPGMDGRDVVRALREDKRTEGCAIVVVSVLDDQDLRDAQVDAVVPKPFRRAAFQQVINRLLTARGGVDGHATAHPPGRVTPNTPRPAG